MLVINNKKDFNGLYKGVAFYNNGDLYEGTFNDKKKFHGQGSYKKYDNNEGYNEIYTGEFNNGLKNGYGECSYPNGNRYKGTWRQDKENNGTLHEFITGYIYYVKNGKEIEIIGNDHSERESLNSPVNGTANNDEPNNSLNSSSQEINSING